MKRIIFILCVGMLAVSINAHAQEGAKAVKGEKAKAEKSVAEVTIKGQVVDISCYLAHGDKGMGESHKTCAEACAKNGSPLGILTKEGKLYVSVLPDDHSSGPNAKLMDHISHEVEVTGIVRTKGGVNGIMITKVAMAEGAGELR